MTRRLVLATATSLILAAAVTPVRAQLFGVVYDPTNYGNAVLRYAQLQQQYTQLVQTYQHLVDQARTVPVDMYSRYRGQATPWQATSASNRSGLSGWWVDAANTGGNAQGAYQLATQLLGDYGDALATIPADQLTRAKTHYATVELADGTNVHSLATLGQLRNHAAATEGAIRGLEDDSYTRASDMNSQIAVLNKINAATVLAVRMGQDTNQLLVSLLEQQLTESKRRRDAEAQEINAQIALQAQEADLLHRHIAGTTEVLAGFRFP